MLYSERKNFNASPARHGAQHMQDVLGLRRGLSLARVAKDSYTLPPYSVALLTFLTNRLTDFEVMCMLFGRARILYGPVHASHGTELAARSAL